jgi:hypothetical protein
MRIFEFIDDAATEAKPTTQFRPEWAEFDAISANASTHISATLPSRDAVRRRYKLGHTAIFHGVDVESLRREIALASGAFDFYRLSICENSATTWMTGERRKQISPWFAAGRLVPKEIEPAVTPERPTKLAEVAARMVSATKELPRPDVYSTEDNGLVLDYVFEAARLCCILRDSYAHVMCFSKQGLVDTTIEAQGFDEGKVIALLSELGAVARNERPAT